MKRNGNRRNKKVWLAKFSGELPEPKDVGRLDSFIESKYVKKKWYSEKAARDDHSELKERRSSSYLPSQSRVETQVQQMNQPLGGIENHGATTSFKKDMSLLDLFSSPAPSEPNHALKSHQSQKIALSSNSCGILAQEKVASQAQQTFLGVASHAMQQNAQTSNIVGAMTESAHVNTEQSKCARPDVSINSNSMLKSVQNKQEISDVFSAFSDLVSADLANGGMGASPNSSNYTGTSETENNAKMNSLLYGNQPASDMVRLLFCSLLFYLNLKLISLVRILQQCNPQILQDQHNQQQQYVGSNPFGNSSMVGNRDCGIFQGNNSQLYAPQRQESLLLNQDKPIDKRQVHPSDFNRQQPQQKQQHYHHPYQQKSYQQPYQQHNVQARNQMFNPSAIPQQHTPNYFQDAQSLPSMITSTHSLFAGGTNAQQQLVTPAQMQRRQQQQQVAPTSGNPFDLF